MRRNFLRGGAAFLTSLLVACTQKEEETPKPASAAKASSSSSTSSSSSSSSASTNSSASGESASVYPPVDPKTLPDIVKVSLKTTKGTILLDLYTRKAPITVANFVRYIEAGKLDNAQFWRAMRSGENGFIQASASGIKFPPIAHEPTSKTGLSHTDGVISMARFEVGTTSNQFTISVGDMSYMDAGRDPDGDNQGYAAFGRVTKGMGVVRAILAGRTATIKVEGGWDKQMLAKPISIISGRRLN